MSIEEKVSVKVLMNTINFAAQQIVLFDDTFRNKLKGVNEVIMWNVGNEISFYTEIKDQKIEGGEGTRENPTIYFEITDFKTALELLTGEKEIDQLRNNIKIAGDIEKIDQLRFILNTIKEHLSELMELRG